MSRNKKRKQQIRSLKQATGKGARGAANILNRENHLRALSARIQEPSMSDEFRARADALITRAMPDLQQRVANMHYNKLDPQDWCLIVGSCELANATGRAFFGTFAPEVPVSDDQIFVATAQVQDVAERIAAQNLPRGLINDFKKPLPPKHVAVLVSPVGGMALAAVPFEPSTLPPAQTDVKISAPPPEARRRFTLLQQNLVTVFALYQRMLAEGLDAADFSVIAVDPNKNAMGLMLIEEVEADEAFVSRLKTEAEQQKAPIYFNFTQSAQLGPFMRDLKIQVDGRVMDSAITRPLQPNHLRVVVCTENGATTFEVERPRPVAPVLHQVRQAVPVQMPSHSTEFVLRGEKYAFEHKPLVQVSVYKVAADGARELLATGRCTATNANFDKPVPGDVVMAAMQWMGSLGFSG